MIDRVKETITNIKKGRNRLTITVIADKAGVSRITIYNRPHLKQLCDQSIQLENKE